MGKCVWKDVGRNRGDVGEDITGDKTGEAFLEESAPGKERCNSEGNVAHGQPMPGQEQISTHDKEGSRSCDRSMYGTKTDSHVI